MKSNALNIVIGGEAGQGLVTIGQVLTKSLIRSGYFVVVTQQYQSRIRGGHNTFAVRVSTEDIAAPQESIDLLVAMDQDTVSIHRDELSEHARVLVDQSWNLSCERCVAVPLKTLSTKRYENTAALGVLASILGLEEEVIFQGIKELIGAKHADELDANREVLSKASQFGAGLKLPQLRLAATRSDTQRMTINGNEAIAMGALSAGVKFCSFYPMTPATTIVLNIISRAKQMGVVAEQAEDEIAAINMALGASYVGAPAFVATSGGGFALMTEGVSLAGITETPIVIAVAQRPGPATGLPTMTEQGDLEFVLHGGHGDFPKAIFSPGSVEECFWLTRKAFEIAERYQSPVFILTDQFLADSYRAVEPPDVSGLQPVRPGAALDDVSLPYRRFALTEDGVSPRLLPGATEHLVLVDSDEHTQEGRITEDHTIRTQMVLKRMKKMQGIISEVVEPSFQGDEDAETILVCWGSTCGSVQEALERLRQEGVKAAMLHFPQVWPLVPDKFLERLNRAKRVVCIEGNATGQFARLVCRETGFAIRESLLRFDGLPITPEWIVRQLGR